LLDYIVGGASMKYSIVILLAAAMAAAGCAQTQDRGAMKSKCAAGDQPACTALAQAQQNDELQAMRSPIPGPATAVGGVGH
jgi:hypothetical protein